MLTAIVATGVNMPFADEWVWADTAFKLHGGTLTWADLWAQHNEHRYVFANLVFVALDELGGWNVVREQCVSLALAVAAQLVLFHLVRERLPGRRGLVAFAAASLLLYSLGEWENFLVGYNLGWHVCSACALAVVYFTTRRHRRWRDVGYAMAVATVASYSLGPGLALWGVGVVALVLARRDRRRVCAAWLAAAVLCIGVYYIGYQPYTVGDAAAQHQLGLLAQYTLAYLGAPLGGWLGPAGAMLVGLCLLASLAAFAVADLRADAAGRRGVRLAPWYALAAYPLAVAPLTAHSRVGLGVVQALGSRYEAITELLPIALIGLLAAHYRQLGAVGREIALAACILAALGYAGMQFDGGSRWVSYVGERHIALNAILTGAPDAWRLSYPDPGAFARLAAEARALGDGPFRR